VVGLAHGPARADRSGSSSLRRTLAGLLLEDEALRTRWTDRVVLVDEDEVRLTAWMEANLRVSWCEHPSPRDVEPLVIDNLAPPRNVGPPIQKSKELSLLATFNV
jgi:hypothetical protein